MFARAMTTLTAVAFLAACGGSQLPEYGPQMSVAQLQVEKTAPGATIDMDTEAGGGTGSLGDLVNAAKTVAGAAGGLEVKDKFSNNFSDEDLETVVELSLRDALGDGTPVRAARDGDTADSRFDVEIYQYGIEREESSPAFMATYKAALYYTDGSEEVEVWSDDIQCKHGGIFDFESGDASVFEAAGFLKTVKEMDDEQFRSLVERGFQRCSNQLVRALRQEAQDG